MKKFMTLVLTAALTLSLSAAVFATVINPNVNTVDLNSIKGFYSGYTLADGLEDQSGLAADGRTYNWGTHYAMDEPQLRINLYTYLFDGAKEKDTTTTSYYAINVGKLSSVLGLSSAQVSDIQTETTNADKIKKLNEALATLNQNKIIGNTTTRVSHLVFSSDNPNTTELQDRLSRYSRVGLLVLTPIKQAGNSLTIAEVNEAGKGGKGYIYFANVTNKGQANEALNDILAEQSVTSNVRNLSQNEINKSKITVGTTTRAGSKAIKSVTFSKKNGWITVKLADELVSTKSTDVELDLYLKFNGKRAENQGLTIYATLENPVVDVYSNYDYVDLSAGYVALAAEFNSSITVDTGNGVYVDTKMFQNRKYYGVSGLEPDSTDTAVMKKYATIDHVIQLKTVNLSSTGNIVRLDSGYRGYYVYDKDLNYLGQTSDKLAYRTKYYLSTKKL